MAIIITYPAGDPSPATLTLPGSNFESPSGYLSLDDINRTFDGTLMVYRPCNKRTKTLKWDYLTAAQKNGLETLWVVGCPFVFADEMDIDNQFTAFMISAPQVHQDFKEIWSGEVEVQEI